MLFRDPPTAVVISTELRTGLADAAIAGAGALRLGQEHAD
jgi:hypothetical protein